MNYGKAWGVYPPAVPGIGAYGFGKPFYGKFGKFGKCGKPWFGCI